MSESYYVERKERSYTSNVSPSPIQPRSPYSVAGNDTTGILNNTRGFAAARVSPVVPIELHKALSTGIVVEQERTRAQELVDLCATVKDYVDAMTLKSEVDGRFEEETITCQFDQMAPADVNENIKKMEEDRNAQACTYEELKEQLERLENSRGEVDEEYRFLFENLIARARAALNALDASRNSNMEKEFCICLGDLLTEIGQLIAVEIEDISRIHARAVETEARCNVFEQKRDVDDWTEEMTHEEDVLYKEVDELLEKTTSHSDKARSTLEELNRLGNIVTRESIDVDEARDQRDTLENALRELRARETVEQGTFKELASNLEADLAKAQAAVATSGETTRKLGEHLKNLSQDLADAHLAHWRNVKRVSIIERALFLLNKKQGINQSLAEHEEEKAFFLLRDCKAAITVKAIAAEMVDETNEGIGNLKNEHIQRAMDALFKMLIDKLHLLVRKFHKTSLEVFAVESSLEILKQEIDGVLVQKKRCNAAKKPARVAECNNAHKELLARVADDEQRMASLKQELEEIRNTWARTFHQIEELGASEEQCDALRHKWDNVSDLLTDIENVTLAKTELRNPLDATFLSHLNRSFE